MLRIVVRPRPIVCTPLDYLCYPTAAAYDCCSLDQRVFHRAQRERIMPQGLHSRWGLAFGMLCLGLLVVSPGSDVAILTAAQARRALKKLWISRESAPGINES